LAETGLLDVVSLAAYPGEAGPPSGEDYFRLFDLEDSAERTIKYCVPELVGVHHLDVAGHRDLARGRSSLNCSVCAMLCSRRQFGG
jgi:hypothetical protein